VETFAHNLSPAERAARVQFALAESAVGSTSGLLTLLASLYRFEPDRAAHLQRVAVTSLSIGDRLQVPRHVLRHVERAALLHELGRLILPDEGFSSEDGPEGRRVHQLQAACDALTAAPALIPAAEILRHLCERVDGRGWPRGLTGEAIPIGARIVSVADAVDALSALCVEMNLPADVLAVELVEHAGTRFDATVVAAVVRWLDQAPLGVPVLRPPLQIFV
jgi:response regulator RpfG family c-di-GMP phosphodiesterase